MDDTYGPAGGPIVPTFTQGDRLRKARELTGLNRADFAAALGVSRQTIANAEHDTHAVRAITLNAWTRVTNVDPHWLTTGHPAPDGDHGCPHCTA